MKTRTKEFSGISSFHCSHTLRAHLLIGNLSFTSCFYVCLHSMLIAAQCRLAKTDSSVNGKPQRTLEAEFKFLRCDCKLSLLFHPAARAPRGSLLAGYISVKDSVWSQIFKWHCGSYFASVYFPFVRE